MCMCKLSVISHVCFYHGQYQIFSVPKKRKVKWRTREEGRFKLTHICIAWHIRKNSIHRNNFELEGDNKNKEKSDLKSNEVQAEKKKMMAIIQNFSIVKKREV